MLVGVPTCRILQTFAMPVSSLRELNVVDPLVYPLQRVEWVQLEVAGHSATLDLLVDFALPAVAEYAASRDLLVVVLEQVPQDYHLIPAWFLAARPKIPPLLLTQIHFHRLVLDYYG